RTRRARTGRRWAAVRRGHLPDRVLAGPAVVAAHRDLGGGVAIAVPAHGDARLGGVGEQALDPLTDVTGHLDAAPGGARHRHHTARRVLDAGRLVDLCLGRQLHRTLA